MMATKRFREFVFLQIDTIKLNEIVWIHNIYLPMINLYEELFFRFGLRIIFSASWMYVQCSNYTLRANRTC